MTDRPPSPLSSLCFQVVTFLLSGLALVIGIGLLLAVVFVEPIVADKYYKRWYDKRKEICAREREDVSRRDASASSRGTQASSKRHLIRSGLHHST